MKKLLSILVIGVVALALPLSANAARITGSCEKNEDCPDGVCQSICTIRVTENTSELTSITGTFVFTPTDGGEIVSITPGDGWTSLNGTTDPNIEFIATDGTVSASEFTLATVVINVSEDITGCKLSLTNANLNKDTPTPDIEIDVETSVEVNTGDTLPIVILACGVGAGAVIYVVTKKNKKLYKI